MLNRKAFICSAGNFGTGVGSFTDGARDALVLSVLSGPDDARFMDSTYITKRP